MASPRKATSSLNLIPEDGKLMPSATKSCESLYSNNSSKGSAQLIYRAKRAVGVNRNNTGIAVRQPGIIRANNEVRQRVLSARRLRMKTYHNQLTDAQQTINELANENRILRTLHKRQDSALAKYESTSAQLPQLLHSHAEELRVWQTKYRNLQTTNKDLEHKLKQKENHILTLSDQNKYYMQLIKDKNLEDRQRLSEKLQNLEILLQEKDNDLKMMSRKLQLETKCLKHQIQLEQRKTKEVLLKLEKARMELAGFRKLEELQLQERFNIPMRHSKAATHEDRKIEKPVQSILSTDTEAVTETEAVTSHRSSQSQHTVRTVRKVNSLNQAGKNVAGGYAAAGMASTGMIQEVPKQSAAAIKSMSTMRRINYGDGDASGVHDVYKMTKGSTGKPTAQLEISGLTNMTHPETQKLSEFEEDSENVDDYENEDAQEEYDGVLNDLSNHKSEETGGFMSNIDAEVECEDGDEDDEFNGEQYENNEKTEYQKLPNTGRKCRMKDDISTIRKKICDDYKEREVFLDSFCRQATGGPVKDDPGKKRNAPLSSSRKHRLLAALKAIDDNGENDEM